MIILRYYPKNGAGNHLQCCHQLLRESRAVDGSHVALWRPAERGRGPRYHHLQLTDQLLCEGCTVAAGSSAVGCDGLRSVGSLVAQSYPFFFFFLFKVPLDFFYQPKKGALIILIMVTGVPRLPTSSVTAPRSVLVTRPCGCRVLLFLAWRGCCSKLDSCLRPEQPTFLRDIEGNHSTKPRKKGRSISAEGRGYQKSGFRVEALTAWCVCLLWALSVGVIGCPYLRGKTRTRKDSGFRV